MSLSHPGKLTLAQFREFSVNFRLNAMDVKDATPAEMRRVLISKLPEFMVKWIVEHEYKYTRERPVVQIITMAGMTEADFAQIMRRDAGEAPLKVVCKGGGIYKLNLLVRYLQKNCKKCMDNPYFREVEKSKLG